LPAAGYGPSPTRLVGLGLVVLVHIAFVYALVSALARRPVEAIRAPIEARIIDAASQEKTEPPPPAPEFKPPPPPFVPPPEIRIAAPPPPPAQSTAITVVATVKPPEPPPPAPAPPPREPVSVLPRIDAAHSREPEYPPVSRRLGEQGSVILQVLVGADGRVAEAKLVQSSGVPRLDEAALAGIKDNYRFTPGTVDGTPQPMWYTFKFTWKLR
jgi:periplasmic protein TonB